MNKKTKQLTKIIISLILIIFSIIVSSYYSKNEHLENKISYEISNIPEYNGEIYVEINQNIPKFNDEDFNIQEDYYSILQNGRVRNGNDKN